MHTYSTQVLRQEERGFCPFDDGPRCLILGSDALFARTDGRETCCLLDEVLTHHHWQLQEAGAWPAKQVHTPFLLVHLPEDSQDSSRAAVPEAAGW